MKKIFLLLAVVGMTITQGCDGDPGPQGPAGVSVEAQTMEIRNVNFALDQNNEYTIIRTFAELGGTALDSDSVLIYRLIDVVDSNTPIWQPIPKTLYLSQTPTDTREFDYDFDFTRVDFKIYAGGNYDISTTPIYTTNQTFRIVLVPGYFTNKVDTSDFNAVKKALNLTEADFKVVENNK